MYNRVTKQFIILLISLLSISIAVAQEYQQQPAKQTHLVRVFPIVSTVTLAGTVIPAKEVTFSAQVSGRVEFIAGEEGDEFEKEAVLLRLTDNELQAKYKSALASLKTAQADVRNADVQFSRELISPDSPNKAPGGMAIPHIFDEVFSEPLSDAMNLGDSKMDRYADLHSYSTKVNRARNHLQKAKSNIETIQAQLRNTQSITAFSGIIIKKLVEIGDTVQAGQALLQFANINRLQIQLEVPARLVDNLRKNMLLPAKLDAGGWGQVRVNKIFPIADPKYHTVRVKLDLPPSARTRPGQYAQVEIQDHQTKVRHLPVIPRQALIWRGSLPSVYVINNDERELRLLRLGTDYGNGAQVSILSGIKGGDVIELKPLEKKQMPTFEAIHLNQ